MKFSCFVLYVLFSVAWLDLAGCQEPIQIWQNHYVGKGNELFKEIGAGGG